MILPLYNSLAPLTINRLAAAGEAPFSPADIAGLQLWLDATTGLYDATSGGSEVTTDGASVARWEDQSGNGYHVTQGTANARPILKTTIQNGLNVLRFDGSNDQLIRSSPLYSGGDARTAFFVGKVTNNGLRAIWAAGSTSGTGLCWDVTPEVRVRVSGRQDFDQAFGTTDFRILTIGMPENGLVGDIYGYLDGAEMNGTPTGVFSINTTNSTFSIGRGVQGSILFTSGDFCEFLSYNSSLSTSDREAVEAYLASKWGITL